MQRSNPDEEVLIAVFGRTGSGKSSFIGQAVGARSAVNHSLLPSPADTTYLVPLDLLGKRVILLDTPGFDDVTMSDMDVLKQIALYLFITYARGYKLHGIVYMHPITDVRAGASTRRQLAMFQQMCGACAMPNVVFVTSMWDHLQASDLAKALPREEELRRSSSLLKPMLDNGAQLKRFHNTRGSALDILALLVHKPATTLRIQEELNVRQMHVLDTSAARYLFEQMMSKFAAECTEFRSALRREGNESVELAKFGEELGARVTAVRNNMRRMDEAWEVEKRQVESMVRSLEETVVCLGSRNAAERLTRLSDDLERHDRVFAVEYRATMSRITALSDQEGAMGAGSTKIVVCGLACILDIVLVVVTGGAVPPVLSSIVRGCFSG